jgi:hypothetical protein
LILTKTGWATLWAIFNKLICSPWSYSIFYPSRSTENEFVEFCKIYNCSTSFYIWKLKKWITFKAYLCTRNVVLCRTTQLGSIWLFYFGLTPSSDTKSCSV